MVPPHACLPLAPLLFSPLSVAAAELASRNASPPPAVSLLTRDFLLDLGLLLASANNIRGPTVRASAE